MQSKEKKNKNPLNAIFGSRETKACYYDHIWQIEINKGNISKDQALAYRKSILDGEYNLFFVDATVGFLTHWIAEKATIPLVASFLYQSFSPEVATTIVGYYGVANLLAIPYFTPRAVHEFRRFTQNNQPPHSKEKLILTGSVIVNAIPVLSALSTPMLNYPRFKDFSGTLIRHFWDEAKNPVKQAIQNFRGTIL